MREEKIIKFLVFIVLLFVPIRKYRKRLRKKWLKKYNVSCFNAEKRLISNFEIKYPEFFGCPDEFSFSESGEHPLVSIIIPVYNQYEYTRMCLWSILNNTGMNDYEIIIADDASTDETRTIRDDIGNIKVVRQKTNQGFLQNCNKAAQEARGKYILFLNNDTQVQSNWLKPLLDTMENDEGVGLVGSKIIYPDNKLQEAGGIVFNDGYASNYGRGGYYNASYACYKKEVDYVSGCSLLLRRSDWIRVGGFDLRYAPAYYEDTDLAFSIREQLGKRVIFQPLSVVMHFEGTSCGTDTNAGIKSYQIVNREKFFEKWKDVLEEGQVAPDDIFHARDRSMGKKTLLFIDYGILHYSMDAGSRASFQYLEYFVREGYNVKFLPAYITPYDSQYLESHLQLGVEVLNDVDFQEWIKEYGKSLDYVYLNRPDITHLFLDLLKMHTSAKLVYQGHDLHYLRLMRKYETSGLGEDKEEALHFKAVETDIFSRVDAVCMFSQVETKMINQMNPQAKTFVVPLFIYDPNEMRAVFYKAQERRNIMFVGGFSHSPNYDAVMWFIDHILPAFVKSVPDVHFFVVGSNPPEELLNMANEHVKVLGMVSDEELRSIYASVKMAVIPLRFGAGVKGKVVEAVFNKIPILTTSIGAEGINNEMEILTVADEEQAFSEKLISLYSNDDLLNEISGKSMDFIRKEFSRQAVKVALKGVGMD